MDAIRRRLRVGAEAADWWAVLHADEVGREERERFVEWLRESHVHVTEMLRMVQVHGALDGFDEWGSLLAGETTTGAEVIAMPHRLPAPETGRRSRRWLPALAASLAGVAILVMAGVWLRPVLGGQAIVTERGERREVVLNDGSIVQVDPQTRLSIRFDERVRRVVLSEGRAVFRVAKHPGRPFLVESDGATVRALGTAFGVERRSRGLLVVTVVDGKVAVIPADMQPPEYLGANQQITLRDARAATPVQAVDGEQALAWAQGKLIFQDDTVGRIVTEFNRYNRVQLRVDDAALAGRRVSGVFDAAYPEEFVAFIQGATPVEVKRIEGRIIILSPHPAP